MASTLRHMEMALLYLKWRDPVNVISAIDELENAIAHYKIENREEPDFTVKPPEVERK